MSIGIVCAESVAKDYPHERPTTQARVITEVRLFSREISNRSFVDKI
jgi:hypothetical protein